VERKFFPEIVPSPSPSEDVNKTDNFDATFDTTPFHFDNKVYAVSAVYLVPPDFLYRATEYIKGATKNPLVVGPNTTTSSDLRIFSSDKNQTMKAYVYFCLAAIICFC
jgi:hypothetical protein